MRIISLVPSITELLYYLGLDVETVGITKFCIHPKSWHQTKPRIGGTKNIDIEKIKSLNPTLIISSKEENEKTQVTELSKFCDILLTDVSCFEDALQMIQTIGATTNRTEQAAELAHKISDCFDTLHSHPSVTAAYIIWKEPWMTVGGDTFIHSMMQKAGFQNIMGAAKRYPEITVEQLIQLQPQYVLLSSEPYPFQANHMNELQQMLKHSKVIKVDGEMFSWYGSRMLEAATYFKKLQQTLLA